MMDIALLRVPSHPVAGPGGNLRGGGGVYGIVGGGTLDLTLVAHTTIGLQFDTGFNAGKATAPAACAQEERELIARLCDGDEAAYETLIERFEHPIYNLVSRLTNDPGDAPDVVQEVFLKVFRNVQSFRGQSSLKTWIYRIAVNESRNHRRWFGRHRSREIALQPVPGDTHSYLDWLPDPARSPMELAMDRERETLIEAALAEINPHYRAALVLRELEGLSYDEIADILQTSLGTVKSRILRGREALRQRLTERLKRENVHAGWSPRTVIAE
jgi:RNA polymerase sigma-70 factor (ECF subfamily)